MNTAEAFTLLSNPDRRHVVRTLLETTVTTIDDLAEGLAASPDADSRTIDQAKIELVHNHLPRLEDYGVIEYDDRNGDVVLDDPGDLETYLSVVSEQSPLSIEQ